MLAKTEISSHAAELTWGMCLGLPGPVVCFGD